MKKYTIHSRKDKTVIMEVECEIVSASEDPAVMWLLPGEYKAKVIAPTSFHQNVEKVIDGKKVTISTPVSWYSHAFYDTLSDAKAAFAMQITEGFATNLRKHGVKYTDNEVQILIDTVEVVLL